jgi:hypothetical protein
MFFRSLKIFCCSNEKGKFFLNEAAEEAPSGAQPRWQRRKEEEGGGRRKSEVPLRKETTRSWAGGSGAPSKPAARVPEKAAAPGLADYRRSSFAGE